MGIFDAEISQEVGAQRAQEQEQRFLRCRVSHAEALFKGVGMSGLRAGEKFTPSRGQGQALRPPVVGMIDAAHKTSTFEAIDQTGDGAAGAKHRFAEVDQAPFRFSREQGEDTKLGRGQLELFQHTTITAIEQNIDVVEKAIVALG